VPLVAGTDALSGFALHAELEFYVRAGIPPADVLRLATIGAATVMDATAEAGAIEPGLRADLVLVDGRPDERMSDIRAVSWVMKSGAVYEPAAIYREIGVQP
jgi:imidazolonepropionase-like amidohydrolase